MSADVALRQGGGGADRLGLVVAARRRSSRRSRPEHRDEIRAKLANFVRAPLVRAAVRRAGLHPPAARRLRRDGRAARRAPPLLPDYQPLDLFVTVTDFHGYPERLRLNSPAEVIEQRASADPLLPRSGRAGRGSPTPPSSAFAARATASFPGAFPPFQVGGARPVLAESASGPGRAAATSSPAPCRARRRSATAETAVLIDGSVLANAPFRPAIGALQNRPARREVDRRFVYIDPKPGHARGPARPASGEAEPPGFFATIFGALSDIPREQPIRDNLEAIEQRSSTDPAAAPDRRGDAARGRGGDRAGVRLDLLPAAARPPKRLAAWRAKAQTIAAREAGYAYAAYGQLKLADVVEEVAEQHLPARRRRRPRAAASAVRQAVWDAGPAPRPRRPRGDDRAPAPAPEVDPLPARLRPRLPHPAAALRRPAARRDRRSRRTRRATRSQPPAARSTG